MFLHVQPWMRRLWLNIMAFCPEHPKWDQNPKLTTLSETTSIPAPLIWSPPPPHPARVVKMASKTVTSTDKVYWPHNIDEYPPLFSRSLNENAKFQKRPCRKPWEILWWLERFNRNSKLKSLSFDVWFKLVSTYPAAGNCFQKTRYPAVRNFDQFSRNGSFNSSKNIRYLFRNVKRL